MQNLVIEKNSKNNDIIESILASRKKAQEEIQVQIDSTKTVINTKTFFTEDFPNGIMSKAEFLGMMDTDSKTQLKAFSVLMEAMTENRKINTNAFAYTDKQGKEYYFIKLNSRNGVTEFKILNFTGLDKLMQGYIFNLYNVNLSLEELYSQATAA